jgi:hypothetical protein
VFEEFFGNTPDVMVDAYGPYEDYSAFFLVVDREQRRPAGALRIIECSEYGLKSLNDLEGPPLHLRLPEIIEAHAIDDLNSCWDIGSLAVLKEYRGAATDHVVSTMLYGYSFAEVHRRGIKHVVTILDKHAYAQLVELMGVPFSPIAGTEPFSYLGSENSRACYGYVPGSAEKMEARFESMPSNVQQLLRPYIARLLYCEGMPELVTVLPAERTSTVRIKTMPR